MKAKLIFVLLGLLGAVYYFWPTRGEQDGILVDRIWITKEPTDPREKISGVLFLSEDNADSEVGVFVESSAFQGNFDAFSYSLNEGKMSLTLLQNNKKAKVTYKATRCKVEGFQYCLEIKGAPRGPVMYYSKKGMEIGSLQEALAKFPVQQ